MEKIIIEKGKKRIFACFHGTGGDAQQLLQIAQALDEEASVIGFNGTVTENSPRRFCKPLINGQLDEEDFSKRIDDFLQEWENLEIVKEAEEIVWLGYSNGANFIQGILRERPELVDVAILLHPMNFGFTFEKSHPKTEILLTGGKHDEIVPYDSLIELTSEIQQTFPNTQLLTLETGHMVTSEEIYGVDQWLKERSKGENNDK